MDQIDQMGLNKKSCEVVKDIAGLVGWIKEQNPQGTNLQLHHNFIT